MQNQIPPVVLTFGAADPVGAIGIQADLASFAAMGCTGLSVITSILVADTVGVEEIQAIDDDNVTEQARVLLEDIVVSAFKIGAPGSIENILAIAEVVADYPDTPLILDPFTSSLAEYDDEDGSMREALYKLLIPQATLLIVSHIELTLLAEIWREPEETEMLLMDAMHLIETGCKYVLVTGATLTSSHISNRLFSEKGVIQNDQSARLPGIFTGAGTTLSSALAACLANGLPLEEAVAEAQEFTTATLAHAQRLGMGKLIPNRYFWMHDVNNTDSKISNNKA